VAKSGRAGADNRYKVLIEEIFREKYKKGSTHIPFEREDLRRVAEKKDISLPKNLGDVIYSFRYRTNMPDIVLNTQPAGKEWIVLGAGRSRYEFRLVTATRIEPNPSLIEIKVPDATPEIVAANAMSDEQALLAKVRYNRLVDIFLGLCAYSLQNHLRTTVSGIGQVEIDEIYVAIDKHGCQYVIPVQAKGGADRLSAVQTSQDLACCAEKFSKLECRALSAQFMADNLICLFELRSVSDNIKIVDEKHYRLVPADDISSEELKSYTSSRSK
jgi:hypothetical protein